MFKLKILLSPSIVRFSPRREFSNRSPAFRESYSSEIPYVTAKHLIENINTYHEVIDVRTPSEHAEDNVLNTATNLPVLSEEERVEVGTLYSKDKFKARKIGAALISRNIHRHVMEHFLEKDKSYRPLIYCWRGGQRSRSLAIVLQEIGFQPTLLWGGYKEYRRLVRGSLCQDEDQFRHFTFLRVSGPTGSGKSVVLESLEERGEQVLHLERLARHKGSVLGQYPGDVQPGQKMFETHIYQKLETEFTPEKVVWVENESSKIGSLIIPLAVWRKMGRSARVQLEASLEDRVQFILSDYHYFCSEEARPELLEILTRLERYAGQKRSSYWVELVREGRYRELVRDLIINYYDVNYKKPSPDPVQTFQLGEGILLEKERLLESQLITDLVTFGQNSLENVEEEELSVHF